VSLQVLALNLSLKRRIPSAEVDPTPALLPQPAQSPRPDTHPTHE